MSTAATQQQPPVIPPRPARSQERNQAGMPKVPPRPVKRAISPNPDRYAPSPLNGDPSSFGKSPKRSSFSSQDDPMDRPRSVEMPSVGEEGKEYEIMAEQLSSSRRQSNSPEQTRTVDDDLKILAPKPSLPAQSAKQRVIAVTRTDSERAAAFGIGKASSVHEGPPASNRSLKKKASTASQSSRRSESAPEDDEHGIPEIGRQVPMYRNAGDVQAPSPAPGMVGPTDASLSAHKRKHSAKGLPPGSYGLHGHGVVPKDKLEKQYYDKHPELLKAERHPYQHDRANDFSMSSEDLNKIVRDTSSRGAGLGTSDYIGMPSEQVGWLAMEESASRPHSTKPAEPSPRRHSFQPEVTVDPGDDNVIQIEEPNVRRSVLFSDEAIPAPSPPEQHDYHAPILADDEVRKGTPSYDSPPAVELAPERRGSAFEMEPPHSRPTSRPASLYKAESSELRSTPLDDVEEYEPLFPEGEKGDNKPLTAAQVREMKQRFPSRDIWEDAPNSVHYTAEVSTPDLPSQLEGEIAEKPIEHPSRAETETPAQAFARKQEELAEKEATHPDSFLWRNQRPAGWVANQPHLARETAPRPEMAKRFPSRDIWEDTPESLKLETTVSGPQQDEASSPADSKSGVPERPRRKSTDPKEKPVVPGRPKPKSSEEIAKPLVPERPSKPHVPARPAKASSSVHKEPAEAPAPKPKPTVPIRPAGSKIAALQAGFMSDLNKRLQLGPHAVKKEEPKHEDAPEEQKKKPLSDARKGRARGPQRRAPAAASSSPAPAAGSVSRSSTSSEKPKLSFSTTLTIFTIDPDDGSLLVTETEAEQKSAVDAAVVVPERRDTPKTEPEPPAKVEEKAEHDEEKKVEDEPAESKTETLATNMAGEPVAEATIETDKVDSEAKPTAVDDTVAKD